MTLRRKALIVVGTTIVGLFLILSVLTRTVLLDNYKQLEAKSVRRNTARVVEAFGAELSYLENSVNDWAAWDETYTFIQEEDDAYIQSNLMDQTFENLRINLMIFIDDMGRVIFSKAFDFGIGQEIPVPIGIYEKISPDSVLLNSPDIQSGYTGFLLLDKKIVLIAAYPIITSKQEGPIQGTLIFGRFLDQDEVERLIKITHLSFTVGPIADTDLPSEIGSIAAFAEENTMLVQPASQETVVGYTLLNDVFEKPALILKVELPREIYQQGLYTLSYLLVLLVVIGIIFGLLTLLLLEKGILSRVSYLNQNVRIYGQNGNLSARLFLQGNDELSSIGAEINKMLEALEMSENALRDGERRNLLRAIPDQLFVFSRDGRCLDHKAGDESFPGRHAQSYVGKSINDFGLSIEAHQMAMYSIQQALDFKSVHAFEFELHQDEHLQYEARFAALNENEVLVIARDMTERVKAQKDLDKSERLYRSLFEDASTANFLINLENIYVAVNQEAADLLDYTREELIGKAISDIVDPSEYPATLNVKQKLLSGECVPPYERSFQKKDGTKIPVEIHPTLIKDSDGQPIYIQSLVRDITERKQMEEELRNAALFPSEDPNPVMRVSADGRLLYANSSSKILLDYWDYDSKRGLPQDLLKAAADTLAKGSTINHDVDYEEKTFSFVIAPITDHGYVNLYGQEIT
jgi:PAS domain S-box-containing protein